MRKRLVFALFTRISFSELHGVQKDGGVSVGQQRACTEYGSIRIFSFFHWLLHPVTAYAVNSQAAAVRLSACFCYIAACTHADVAGMAACFCMLECLVLRRCPGRARPAERLAATPKMPQPNLRHKRAQKKCKGGKYKTGK